MDLSKKIRTDPESIEYLQDGDPSYIQVKANSQQYFAFPTSFNINPKGFVSVGFSASEAVEVYLSDIVKKPTKKTSKKTIRKSDKFSPFDPIH